MWKLETDLNSIKYVSLRVTTFSVFFFFTTSSDDIENNACLVDQIKSKRQINIAKVGLPFAQHELNPGE